MESVAFGSSGTPCAELKFSQTTVAEENQIRNGIKASESDFQTSCEEHSPENELKCLEKVIDTEKLDKGCLEYGYDLLAFCINCGCSYFGDFMLIFVV